MSLTTLNDQSGCKPRIGLNKGGIMIALNGTRGAIDLASVMVGILVVGIIGGIIAAVIFALIPWTQDNTAKANIGAVHTAESAYRGFTSDVGQDSTGIGKYATNRELVEFVAPNGKKGLLQENNTLKVETATSTDGEPCYAVASKSDSGKIFYGNSASNAISTDPASNAFCVIVDFPVDDTGPGTDNPGTDNPGIPAADDSIPLTRNVASSAQNGYKISGYGLATAEQVESFKGLTVLYPNPGEDISLSYYDKSSNKLVEFYNEPDNWNSQSGFGSTKDGEVYLEPSTNQIFGHFYDEKPKAEYAEGFTKMSENGGSMTFEDRDVKTNITVVWYPSTSDEATNSPTWPSLDPTDGGTPGGTQPTNPNPTNPGGDTGGEPTYKCGPEYGSYNFSNTSEYNNVGIYTNQDGCNYRLNSTKMSGFVADPGNTTIRERHNGYFFQDYYQISGSGDRTWVAANGSNVEFSYLNPNGSYTNFLDANQNSSKDYTGNTTSPGADGVPTSYAPTFDPSKPEVSMDINMRLTSVTSPMPDECLNQFFADSYNGRVTFPGDENQQAYTVDCAKTYQTTKFDLFGLKTNTEETGAGFLKFSEFGGKVSFITTEGTAVTVYFDAGSWGNVDPNEEPQAS